MDNRVSIYLEQEILSANKVQLVHILYQAAIGELRDARRNLIAKRIPAKCANLSKACQLVGELLSSLDHDSGGQIAAGLDELYRYMLAQILQANLRNQDEPIAQVIGLLSTLDEAWKQLANERAPHELTAAAASFATQFSDTGDASLNVWSL